MKVAPKGEVHDDGAPVVIGQPLMQPQMPQMMVSVPPGAVAGSQIMVQTPQGAMLVAVPPGVPPGGSFPVAVPPMQQAVPTKGMVTAVAPMLAPPAQGITRPAYSAEIQVSLLKHGTTSYGTECTDCCRFEEFPICVCAYVCTAVTQNMCPMNLLYWMWYGNKVAMSMGEADFCGNLCCACLSFEYLSGKVVQAKRLDDPVDCGWCCRWTFCKSCEIWRLRRELKAAPHLKSLMPADEGNWKQSLCGCCDRPGLACLTLFCYPCALGQFYADLGENCCVGALCGGFCLQNARGRVAYAKGIKEPVGEYGLKVCCCRICMDCQLFAEVRP